MSVKTEMLSPFPTLKYRYQCKLCGEKFQVRPMDKKTSKPKCLSCGCPNIRDVQATGGKYDVVPRDTVAHLKRPLEDCWNESVDPTSGEVVKHKFVEKLVPVVDIAFKEYHDELRCGRCGRFYANYNGRAATSEEMDKAQANPPTIEIKYSEQ